MRDVLTERERAYLLAAGRILDRINADPDGDLALVARQLICALEELETLRQIISSPPMCGQVHTK